MRKTAPVSGADWWTGRLSEHTTQKSKVFRSRKLLNYAKEYPCIRCGRDDGTPVAAHYSGRYASLLGKGTGIKPHDSAIAILCYACHQYFDTYKAGNTDERAAEFLLLIVKQTAQLFLDGKLEVK